MTIRVERVLRAAPDRVWAIVGDPVRTDWVPGVESCTYDGRIRRFRMAGAGTLAERIVRCDAVARCIEYSVIESKPALAMHLATIEVEDAPEGSVLIWRTTVDPVSVEPFIRRSMEAALDQLERVLASES